jgi:tetratricopeptide (TPR) repeat protein
MKTEKCCLVAGTLAVLCAMVQLASAQTPGALDREAALAAARTGKWEVAEAPLTKLADGHPADADACALLAQRRQQQNRAKDAVELMERAVAAQPNRADLQAQLGDALGQRMGEVSFFKRPSMGGKMREAFERSIALDPLHVPALIGLTKCCLYAPAIGGGSATKAEEYARRAQKLDPVYGSYWLGQTLERQERWSDAAQAYRQGLAAQDQHGWLYGNLGNALMKAGQKDAARAAFVEALRRQPDLEWVRKALAELGAAPAGSLAF